MLKKRKHKIKRRNTEPTVNHQLVLATPSAGGGSGHSPMGILGPDGSDGTIPEYPPNVNLADICDSPTHATAVWLTILLHFKNARAISDAHFDFKVKTSETTTNNFLAQHLKIV